MHGLLRRGGELTSKAVRVITTPSMVTLIQEKRPDVTNITVENYVGMTIRQIAAEMGGKKDEDIFILAAITSEVEAAGSHNVLVKSIGPDFTNVNDPSRQTGGEDKLIPTTEFIERFSVNGGFLTAIRVHTSSNV